MTPEEKMLIEEDFYLIYCSLSKEEQDAVITCTNAAIPTKDGAVIPAEYVAELICHLYELWKLDISEDDIRPLATNAQDTEMTTALRETNS